MIPMHIRAVCVGINQYLNPSIPPLQFAEDDARYVTYDLRGLLERRRGDRALWVANPNEDVVALLGREATHSNIKRALNDVLVNRNDRAEVAIFYFSGHGMRDPDSPSIKAFLGNVDIDPFDIQGTGLGMNELYEDFFIRVKAKFFVAMIDCCYSGHTANAKQIDDSILDLFQRKEGNFVLTSSSSDQTSKEEESLKGGVFSYFLGEGIQSIEAADQETGELTIPLLFNYVYSRVVKQTGNQQQPHLGGRGANVILRHYTPSELREYKYARLRKQSGGRKPVCRLCGMRYGFDNVFICMSCGATFCYQCLGQLKRVQKNIESIQNTDWWVCLCGGLVD